MEKNKVDSAVISSRGYKGVIILRYEKKTVLRHKTTDTKHRDPHPH